MSDRACQSPELVGRDDVMMHSLCASPSLLTLTENACLGTARRIVTALVSAPVIPFRLGPEMFNYPHYNSGMPQKVFVYIPCPSPHLLQDRKKLPELPCMYN